MRRVLTNPYLAIILAPLLVFVLLVYAGTPADTINVAARVYVFSLFAYVGARYVGRAPALMLDGNMSPEARNIVGWSLVCLGSMLQMAYGVVYIAWDRPDWLASQFWGPAFVALVGVGLTLVASSVPRLPPFGNNTHGLSVVSSFLVGISGALFLFVLQHIAQAFAILKAGLFGLVHAL